MAAAFAVLAATCVSVIIVGVLTTRQQLGLHILMVATLQSDITKSNSKSIPFFILLY